MLKTDVLIIGAGPVGIFAAFEAGMLGMKSVIVDCLDQVGGQCSALYPEKPIYDIPAYPKILAGDLIEKLKEQADRFSPEYLLSNQVVSFKEMENKFLVKTDKNIEIEAKIIIIAAGSGAFGPNRPPLENIREYEGKSVFYMVKKAEDFRGKKIAIAGGGDSAIDWAVILSNVAEKIYLVHRRDKFRAAPASLEQVNEIAKTGKIEFVFPYQLRALQGQDGILDKLILYDLEGNEKSLDVDCLLAFFGLSMELGPIREWGLELKTNHISVDKVSCMTNIDGIYAIGDVANYEGKLKLILTGFAEAASALHHSYKRVFDGKALHFEYSTSKNIENI